MSRIKQFAGQTIVYGLGHILSKLFYFLLMTTYLTYRLKDQLQVGIYQDLYAYASLLIILFSFRMDTAFFRFGSKKEHFHSAFSSSYLVTICCSIIILIFGFCLDDQIANFLKYPDSPRYVRWFSVILCFDVLALLPYAKLRLENKARAFVLFRIFNVLLTSFLVLILLELIPKKEFANGILSFIPRYEYDIDYVFIANLISSAVVFILLLFTLKSAKFIFNYRMLKKMLYYAFPLIIVGVCGSFNQFFGVPLQKYFLGDDVLNNLSNAGVYGSSQKIASIFLLFTTAFNYAAEPFFFNNSKKEDRQLLYGKICRLFVLVGGALILFIYLGIDLIQYIVDETVRGAIFVVPILLIAYLFLGIYYNISIWYKLADKTIYGAFISLVGVVITTAISLIYLTKVGYVASAWAALCTFVVMVVLGYLLGQKHFPVYYPVKKILLNIMVILGLMFLSYLAKPIVPSVVFILINILLLIVYLVYMWLAEKEQWLAVLLKERSISNP